MSYIGSHPAASFAKATSQTFTGDNSDVTFTLNKRVSNPEDLEVFVSNIQQQPTTSYTIDSDGVTLRFSEAPPSGQFYVVYRNLVQQTGIDTGAARLVGNNTFTGNQTITGNVTGAGMDHLLSATISSAVSAYDIDSTYINSTHDNYFIMAEFLPATDDVALYLRAFVGGTIQDGSIYARETASLAFGGHRSTNSSSYFARFQYYDMGNATGEGISLQGHLQNVNNTARSCCITGQSSGFSDSGNQIGASFSGSLLVANAANVVNGLRFVFEGSDIASGTVKLYGLKD